MLKQNQWTGGQRHFVGPLLNEGLVGKTGCTLQRCTFDTSVGEEIHLLYIEDPGYAEQYGNVSPFNLLAHFGLARTPYGVVAFIVWQIAIGAPEQVAVDQYLNPQNFETIRLLASAANQTHLKLIVVNNRTSEITAFVDFENTFAFDKMVSAMVLSIGHEPLGDFGAATEYVMNSMSIPDLLSLSAEGQGIWPV
jgi:hypothetical protein